MYFQLQYGGSPSRLTLRPTSCSPCRRPQPPSRPQRRH